MILKKPLFPLTALLCLAFVGCDSTTGTQSVNSASTPAERIITPGQIIDLSYWNITVPLDYNKDSRPDTVGIPQISRFYHPDFFYVNSDNHVVFASPNKAATTANSSNTRSELRHMSRGDNKSIRTKDYGNNFAILANPKAKRFASVGGKLEATLRVNHAPVNAGHPHKAPAFSAVIGQIHGVKEDTSRSSKFGFGNEPLKIYYKKFPNHNTGSVFWTYERNLAKADPARTDISYPVWGNTWEVSTDPGSQGIALDEEFSYTVNVFDNIMYLTFTSTRLGTVKHQIDLSNNIDANGNIDPQDNPKGYSGDQMYFKAGIYNQCSTQDQEGFWYTACPGTGDWAIDKANGDYAQSTFSKLVLSSSHAPQ